MFSPCNKSDPLFGLKSLVIPDPILLSPEPFPLSPDPSHILGFEPWAHIPYYDPDISPSLFWELSLCLLNYRFPLQRIGFVIFPSYFSDYSKNDIINLYPSLFHHLTRCNFVIEAKDVLKNWATSFSKNDELFLKLERSQTSHLPPRQFVTSDLLWNLVY